MSFNIEIPTREDIIENLVTELLQEYPNFNTNNASPLATIINVITFAIQENYNNWLKAQSQVNLLTAEGLALDVIGYILGNNRKKGFFTEQEIEITTDRALTLYGLDNTSNEPYTVIDSNNNRYILKTTSNLINGANTLIFQSEEMNAISSEIGTITTAISVVNGIVSVNNEVEPIKLGSPFEDDATYRRRIENTRQSNTQGMDESLYSQLLNLKGVQEVDVFSNNTANAIGEVPAGHVYTIILGGDANDILTVFKNNVATTPTFGNIMGTIRTIQGQYKTYKWDVPETISIELQTTIKSFEGDISSFESDIKQAIQDKTDFKVNQTITVAEIEKIIQEILTNKSIKAFPYNTEIKIKDSGLFGKFLIPSLRKHKFGLIASDINITFLQ